MNAVTIIPAPETEHWALPGLAENIRAEVQAADTHARTAMTSALRAGELLTQAKTYVPHGQWEAWITANSPLTVRTAQAYMRLAKNIELLPEPEAQRVALLPIREAIRAITTDPEPPARERLPSVCVSRRTDRERVVESIKRTVNSLKSTARVIECGLTVKGTDVAKLKRQLQAALEQVAELERDHDATREVQP